MRNEAHFATKGNRSPLAVPESLLARLEAVDEARGDQRSLMRAIARMSEAYTTDRASLGEVGRSAGGLRARLRFFLPRDLPKALRPMLELERRGLLPAGDPLRVLDLGAGLGTTSLSVARALALSGDARALSVLALDEDARALDAFARIAAKPIEGFAPIQLHTRRASLPGALEEISDRFDLVTIGLALNELGAPEALLRLAASRLAPGGVLLILEPALRETTRALMHLRDGIAEHGELAILGPCPHHAPCPMLARERDWCHDAVDVPLSPPLDGWARAAGLRDDRPTFAWLALGARARPDDVAHRVVSHRLPSKGKLELILCGPEGELSRARRLDRHASEANASLTTTARGDRLEVTGEARGGALVIGESDAVVRR